MTHRRRQFEADGRLWLRNAVGSAQLNALSSLIPERGKPGQRIESDAWVHEHLVRSGLNEALTDLWPSARPVRLVAFDKAADANWGLPWHQDRVIAVQDRVDLPGFDNWSKKAAIWHCEPPVAVLNDMLFVRVHLDPSTSDNGAMEIALGSHLHGRMPSQEAASYAKSCQTEITLAEPGDVLVLSMLTLHRSRPSRTTDRRRVLRVDYALSPLPHPLQWAFTDIDA